MRSKVRGAESNELMKSSPAICSLFIKIGLTNHPSRHESPKTVGDHIGLNSRDRHARFIISRLKLDQRPIEIIEESRSIEINSNYIAIDWGQPGRLRRVC